MHIFYSCLYLNMLLFVGNCVIGGGGRGGLRWNLSNAGSVWKINTREYEDHGEMAVLGYALVR